MSHRAIPTGVHRIKMVVDAKLVTLASLRHYRDVLTEQAHISGWRVTDRRIHAHLSPYTGKTALAVLEMRVRKAGLLDRRRN